MDRESNKRVVVIGAGPGGLASSILLAAAGCDVTLLEARERVGGRTSSHEEAGFRFDNGPTFFLYPQILESIFESAGRRLRDEVELIELETLYRVMFGDGTTLDATRDIEEMSRRVAAISPGDGAAVARFFSDNVRKLDSFLPFLQKPFLGPRALLDPKLMALLPALAPWRQLDRELERYFDDPRVRMAFSFQALYLGMTPRTCPSLFSILPLIEYRFGVFHPKGGCGAVMDAMARVASELGVDVRLNEPVEKLHFDGRRVTRVETGNGRYEGSAVVVNADFANAMQALVPDVRRRHWKDRRIRRQRYSCSTFMLYLGLEGEQSEQPHHTVYIPNDYRKNLEDIEHARALTDDPAFYVQNASVTDRSLAPEGHSTLYMLLPVANEHEERPTDWKSMSPRYRALALEQLAKAGFEDIERRIVYERQVTPANWARDFHVHRGATFNLAHNFAQMLHRRPRNRFEDLDNVYLVGGGTHPGSGLPTIFESARISTRLLCEDLNINVPFVTPAAMPGDAVRSVLDAAGRRVGQRGAA